MTNNQTFKFFTVSMITVSVIVAGIAIAIFDHFEIKEQQKRLRKIVENRTTWINSLIQSPSMSDLTKGGKEQALLKILSSQNHNFPELATTGEFTLGKHQADNIIFLLSLRYKKVEGIQIIPWNSQLAQPMRKALQGESGSIVALDYRGEKVIAAYEPIKALNWGIVAKIDLIEVRKNSLINTIYIILATIVLNLFALILTKPIFKRLEASELELQQKQEQLREELEQKVIKGNQALLKFEQQYKSIFENFAIGIIVTTIKGEIIQTNQTFQNLTNYNEDELSKLNLTDLIEVNDLIVDILLNLQSENKPLFYKLEKRLICQNQELLWAKLTISIWNDLESKTDVLIVMVEDITITKEAEITEEKLIRRNQSLVQSLGEIVYEHLVLEDIINWDGNYTELLGYSWKEMGNNGDSWLNKVHPDDLIKVKKEFDQAFNENRLYDLEYRFRHKDGNYLWFHDSGIMYLDSNGELLEVIGIMRNITPQKEAEKILQDINQHYQTILNNTLEGFLIIDLAGNFVEVNDAYCQMIGYSRAELLEMYISDIEAVENPELIEQHIANIIQNKSELFETKHRCKDGSIIDLEVNSNYIESRQCLLTFMRNITQRKLAEKELEESKIKYQRLVDDIGDKFIIYSHTLENGILTYVSDGFKSIFGKEIEEVINKPWFDVIDWQEEDIKKGKNYNDKLLRDNKDFQQFELNFIKPDGIIGTVMIAHHIYRDQQGNPLAIEGIAEDITERKQAEIALQESEIKFRTFVQKTGTIIIILSPECKVLEWNIEAERIYGYSREQILDQDYSVLCLLPEDRKQVNREIQKILAGEITRNFEHIVLTKDGENRNILWNLSSFTNAEGKIIGIAKVGQDITERKQAEIALQESEQKLRTLINFTYDWEYWLDPNGKLVYISPSCERITGYSDQTFYQDPKLLKKIIYAEDRELYHQHHCEKIEENQRSIIDFRIVTSDGEIRWIGHVCRLVYDTNGECLGVRVSNRDINDRKNAEAKLQELNKKLQVANEELQDWNQYLEQQNHEMQLLEKLNDFLPACLTLEEAYQAIPDLIKPLFPESSGAIYIIENSHNIVNSVASWGDYVYIKDTFFHNDCWALRRGQLHFVDSQHPHLLCKHISHQHPSLQSLCVPMMAQGNTIGLVYIVSIINDNRENILIEQKQTLAKTIAEQLSLSLANLKLRETLQNQSIKDPLTGLFNRRYMEEFLTKEFYHAERKGYSIGIMMLDIDHFKNFNDNFGHDAGDAVLREIGIFLLDNIRGSDIACRYGGEELTVILPEADLENTKKRAETIREGIKKLQVKSQGKLLGIVTTSIGIACFPQHGNTIEEVIKVADNALFQAKESGRDQVKFPYKDNEKN